MKSLPPPLFLNSTLPLPPPSAPPALMIRIEVPSIIAAVACREPRKAHPASKAAAIREVLTQFVM